MDILSETHKIFLIELLNAKVNFMLIGGYAVNFHGYPRYTSDMDIWLQPDDVNKQVFISFLSLKKFSDKGIQQILNIDFTLPNAFHIGKGETRIDFLTAISGTSFESAFEQKVLLPLGNLQIPVINFEHLIKNKKTSNRLKDLADVEELQKINQFRNKS